MYRSFSDFLDDVKNSGKDWIKSQLKISAITFALLTVGLFIIDQAIVPVAWAVLIPFIALGIAIVDAIPVIGISACMLPWAAILALFGSEETGKKAALSIFVLFIIVMIIKQIIEPFIRGKSLGVSPIEEVVSAVIGYFVFGGSGIGFVAGPLIYTIGKKVYLKFNPDGFFAQKSTPYFKNSNSDDEIIDISDDVVDVEEDK